MGNKEVLNRFDRNRVVETPGGKSLTQQHMAAETDINNIVGKYLKTGILGNPNATRRPQFGDFTGPDFQTMKNAIADIQQEFNTLRASLRKRFGNDPYQLMRWLDDPRNQAEAIKLGLVEGPENEDPFETSKEPVKEPEAALKADPEAQPSHVKKAPEKGVAPSIP